MSLRPRKNRTPAASHTSLARSGKSLSRPCLALQGYSRFHQPHPSDGQTMRGTVKGGTQHHNQTSKHQKLEKKNKALKHLLPFFFQHLLDGIDLIGTGKCFMTSDVSMSSCF